MSRTPLDPRISEFATQEEADSYDEWFREQVQQGLDDTRPRVAHDEAMARVQAVIERNRKRHANG
ncbi:type II toxin-antitoxin system RelB family antitoxin [Carnimonas bestiolae]|uniref:type II toxin-antitoxin system RelB family antitoxin n=1 Tax=Carnimonas bestiolae TaxID=3402172 RepID=UPI003EDB788F